MTKISYSDYLAAKKTVDDRALHPRILIEFCNLIALQKNPSILELGAGVGTMLERLWNCGLRFQRYTLVDELEANRDAAIGRLTKFFRERKFVVALSDTGLTINDGDSESEVDFTVVDCFQFLDRNREQYDGLIASALLDLLPLSKAVSTFLAALKQGGVCYLPINFDGETIFEPTLNREREQQLMNLYHATMDTRLIEGNLSGDSRTGRKLFAELVKHGANILDAAASDWVVFSAGGMYPADEAVFLRFILDTVLQALRENKTALAHGLEDWYQQRLNQLKRGELVYIAHQMDFVVKRC
ncbi:MAG: hypothetical protein ACRBF0_07310 [Calditrichia bacterium]